MIRCTQNHFILILRYAPEAKPGGGGISHTSPSGSLIDLDYVQKERSNIFGRQ